MSVKLAIQMNDIRHIHIEGDTSFALLLEAQKRGVEIFYYEPSGLSLEGGELYAEGAYIRVADKRGGHCEVLRGASVLLRERDVILIRQDPPFDMAYLTTTYLLEGLCGSCVIVNDPRGIRNISEKLFAAGFADVHPPSLVSGSREKLAGFFADRGEVIVKPLYGGGGADIFHLKKGDENLNALLDMFFARSVEPIIMQKYLPEIAKGDKRIILVEGEPMGAVLRVPKKGEARANLHRGGEAKPCEISAGEREIAARIAPVLKKEGIVLAGMDVIGGLMTEVNVTSPTCVREILKFGGADIAALVWDAILARLAALR